MTIAAEGILAAELSDLAYNKDTGVLTGTINVLNAANGSALNRTECAIRGILTPITSDCCRETADWQSATAISTTRTPPISSP